MQFDPRYLQTKLCFLLRFKDAGFKKVKTVIQELNDVGGSVRYMVMWANTNGLLVRGQKGYYKLSAKGLKWLSMAEELARFNAFEKVCQLYEMAPKKLELRRRSTKRKHSSECEEGRCFLIGKSSVKKP